MAHWVTAACTKFASHGSRILSFYNRFIPKVAEDEPDKSWPGHVDIS